MSDKPASPAFGSPRAPAIVAVICVGMVIVAATGALMLFTAPGGAPAASPVSPSSAAVSATDEPEADTAVESVAPAGEERTVAAARSARRNIVPTVAPPKAPVPVAHPPQDDPTTAAPTKKPRRHHHQTDKAAGTATGTATGTAAGTGAGTAAGTVDHDGGGDGGWDGGWRH